MAKRVEVMTRKDLRDLSVVATGQVEILDWWLYDTLNITNATTSARFFQQASGNSGITEEQTNMEIPGQLPAGYKFVAQKIVAQPVQNSAFDKASALDILKLTHAGWATLSIGTRPYAQLPMQAIIGGGMLGVAALDASAAPNTLAYLAPKTVLNGELEYSPVIPNNYSFAVTCQWNTAPTVATTTALRIILVGKLVRPLQG